jgi:adenine deaminase
MAAVNRLAEIGRGQVVMADGRSVAELPCPIGRLMSDLAAEEAAAAVRRVGEASRTLRVRLASPFMALSFLASRSSPS